MKEICDTRVSRHFEELVLPFEADPGSVAVLECTDQGQVG